MVQNLEELMLENLRDIYDAEHQAVKAIPKMAKTASSQDVKKAFLDHAEQTKGQIKRLEEIFEKLGEAPKGKHCRGMEGLVAEAEEHMAEEMDPEFRDAMLVGAEMKAEHYEMAAYQSAIDLAELMNMRDAIRRLKQNMTEEERMTRKLTQLSMRWNKKMLRMEQQQQKAA